MLGMEQLQSQAGEAAVHTQPAFHSLQIKSSNSHRAGQSSVRAWNISCHFRWLLR